jgi:hypothetical protein
LSKAIAGKYSATITVVDRRKGSFALDATIPDLGDYDIRFIKWVEAQGNAPAVGMSGLAEMAPTSRQKRFLPGGQKHKYDTPDIDGSEWASEVEWAMVAFHADTVGAPAPDKSPSATPKPLSVGSVNGGGLLSAQDRWVADHRMKNARDAIWMAIERSKQADDTISGTPESLSDMVEDLVMASLIIRDELNQSLDDAAGLDGPSPDVEMCFPGVPESELVEAAKRKGAEVVGVIDNSPAPTAVSAADVRAYVLNRQDEGQTNWGRDEVVGIFVSAGFKTLDEYIAAEGHTAQGALDLLREKLDW